MYDITDEDLQEKAEAVAEEYSEEKNATFEEEKQEDILEDTK